MNNTLTLNVYDDDFENVVKTLNAKYVKLGFGTVSALLKLIDVDNAKNTGDILGIVANAWDKITTVLSKAFTDATEDDWDHVSVDEVLAVVMNIVEYALNRTNTIPTEKN